MFLIILLWCFKYRDCKRCFSIFVWDGFIDEMCDKVVKIVEKVFVILFIKNFFGIICKWIISDWIIIRIFIIIKIIY